MELWDKQGNFVGSKDKAKKVLDIIRDEKLRLLEELIEVEKREAELVKFIVGE